METIHYLKQEKSQSCLIAIDHETVLHKVFNLVFDEATLFLNSTQSSPNFEQEKYKLLTEDSFLSFVSLFQIAEKDIQKTKKLIKHTTDTFIQAKLPKDNYNVNFDMLIGVRYLGNKDALLSIYQSHSNFKTTRTLLDDVQTLSRLLNRSGITPIKKFSAMSGLGLQLLNLIDKDIPREHTLAYLIEQDVKERPFRQEKEKLNTLLPDTKINHSKSYKI